MNDLKHFIQHLLPLKKMLMRFGCAYLLISVPFIYYAKECFEWGSALTLPSAQAQLIATDITSTFMIPLKWALLSSFLLSLPLLFVQIWYFIAPALYPHEKKWLKPLFILALILFYIGASFAFMLVCPMAIQFFSTVAPNNLVIMTDIHHYYDFVINLMLAFGFSFEIPIIVFICIHLGWISRAFFIKKRPYIIVGAFIIGMLLTPPDVVSQIMLAIPLWLLFESGLWISSLKFVKSGVKS